MNISLEELNNTLDTLIEQNSLKDAIKIEDLKEKDQSNADINQKLIENINLNEESINIP